MKILSYRHQGKDTYGVLAGDGVCDVGRRIGDRYPDLGAVLAAGALAEIATAADGQSADAGLDDITYLPVLAKPDKILMVGLNYRDHQAETKHGDTDHPSIFIRYPDSQVGHRQPMISPTASDHFDYEGELAVIIGTGGRHISEQDALGHVAGYSCYNDGSIRDFQRHTTQWAPGKNFVGTGAFGPWMVTADEIPDPQTLTLITRLNGEEMQHSTTDLMIFQVAELINYCSTFCNLVAGDVIVSGTPGGVGFARTPPVYMKAGDTVEIDISNIGVLANRIEDE